MDEIEDKFDKFYKYGGTYYWKLTWEQIFDLKNYYFRLYTLAKIRYKMFIKNSTSFSLQSAN